MKTHVLKAVVLLLFVFILIGTPSRIGAHNAVPQIALAQEGPEGNNAWSWRGPKHDTASSQAPQVIQILIDRTNPSIVYAGTNQGVYRSTDGGETWVARNQGLGGYGDLVISGLALHPTNSQTLFIGTWGYGIFRTTDSGAHWTRLPDPLAASGNAAEISAGLPDDGGLPLVRAGGFSYTLASDPQPAPPEKNGLLAPLSPNQMVPAHFPEQPDGLPNSLAWTPVRRVVLHPSNGNEIYACIDNGYGLYRSTNGGSSWTELSIGDGSARAYVFAPSNSQIRYAAFSNGVYRTLNGGSSWDLVGSSTISGTPFSIAIHPTDPNIVLVGTWGGGLYRTANGGGSWSLVSGDLSDSSYYSVAFAPSNPNIVYAGSYLWIYRSTNAGASWTNADSSFATYYVEGLAIHPSQPETVLAGANKFPWGGVYKRTNSSAAFQLKPQGMDDTFILDIEQDPSYPNTLYAATWGAGVFRSDDGGYTWSPRYSVPYVYSLEATQGVTSTILYAGTFYSDWGVLKSYDYGNSWTEVSYGYASDISFDLESVYDDPNWLVAATYRGMEYTYDGGQTWYSASYLNDGVVLGVCEFPGTGRLLAATYGGGVFYSRYGYAWYDANLGLSGTNSLYDFDVSCSPDVPGLGYAASQGVYRTLDYGEHWQRVSIGLPSDFVRALDIAPGTRDVFAGTHQSGVYIQPKGQSSWKPVNANLSELRTRAVKVVSTSPYPRAIVGTNGKGTWDYTLVNRPSAPSMHIPAAMKNYASFLSAGDTYEYNNSLGSAYYLPAPGTYHSFIWSPSDQDWYRINVTSLGEIQMKMDEIVNGADYDLELYNSAGVLLAGSWWGSNRAEELRFQPIQSGNYYVKVFSFSGSDQKQAYRLKLSYNGPPPTSGQIYGTVRMNGSLVSNAPVVLNYYNGFTTRRVSTVTDGAGIYRLRGQPALPLGHSYRVSYNNYEENNQRLSSWSCYSFTGYTAGQTYAACSFDIADVAMVSPNGGAYVALPVTFYWNRRAPSTDNYWLQLFGLGSDYTFWESTGLGYANSYDLSSLPTDFTTGVTYGWDVYVTNDSGYGYPYYYRTITFSGSEALAGQDELLERRDLPYLPQPANIDPGIDPDAPREKR